jgi:hypothetical protein
MGISDMSAADDQVRRGRYFERRPKHCGGDALLEERRRHHRIVCRIDIANAWMLQRTGIAKKFGRLQRNPSRGAAMAP